MKSCYHEITLTTGEGLSIHDISDEIRELVESSGIREGLLGITSKHTTCALVVNENEERLLVDIRDYFLQLAPPDRPYLHNDLHLRKNIPPNEPENAHAHLIAMMLGNSEQLCIHQGQPVLGQYQSVLLVELDGSRQRQLALQILGD